MAAYTQFGYSYPTASQLLVSSQPTPGNNGPGGGNCCENGRLLIADPVSGQSVCSCQYDSARLAALQSSYPRLTGSAVYSTTYPSSEQNPYPSIGMDAAAFYPTLGNHYSLKEGATPGDMSAWTGATLAQSGGYYPYDPTLAAYGYGAGYDLAARRKNATRESTATLKAWLNEHKKNPYPTKGEKIMLAIITKMTLTQVSTWFANARRRLKKENKMTWEPKNRVDDDDAVLSDEDDEEERVKCKADKDMESDDEKLSKRDSDHMVSDSDIKDESKSSDEDKTNMSDDLMTPARGSAGYNLGKLAVDVKVEPGVPIPATKPKIWSLADTATCKTPPPSSQAWFGNNGMFQIPSSLNSSAMYNRFPGLLTPVSSGYNYNGLLPPTSVASHPTTSPNYPDAVQTDTPPQTPPNMKVPGNLGSVNYNMVVGAQYSSNSQGLAGLVGNRGTLVTCDRDMPYSGPTSPDDSSPFRRTYK